MTNDKCAICHQFIQHDGYGWIHPHSNDVHCGTGDGSVAYPEGLS